MEDADGLLGQHGDGGVVVGEGHRGPLNLLLGVLGLLELDGKQKKGHNTFLPGQKKADFFPSHYDIVQLLVCASLEVLFDFDAC